MHHQRSAALGGRGSTFAPIGSAGRVASAGLGRAAASGGGPPLRASLGRRGGSRPLPVPSRTLRMRAPRLVVSSSPLIWSRPPEPRPERTGRRRAASSSRRWATEGGSNQGVTPPARLKDIKTNCYAHVSHSPTPRPRPPTLSASRPPQPPPEPRRGGGFPGCAPSTPTRR